MATEPITVIAGHRTGEQTRPGSGAGHKPQLDGLRALAVLAVAWSHWERPYQFGIPFGAGVHLFYVLSGCLITGILLGVREAADRAAAVKAFYVRRALRIFPAFYLTLALAWWVDVPLLRESLGWHAAYLSNVWIVARNEWPGTLSHFWSLAVEEQFYLVWPWLIVFAPRRWLLPAIVGSIAISPLFRLLLGAAGYRESLHGVLTPGSLDSLAFGALLAAVGPAHAARLLRPSIVCGATLVSAAILWAQTAGVEVPLAIVAIKGVLQAIVFGWMVLRAADGVGGVTGRILSAAPIVYLGRISYGVYLAHGFAGVILWEVFGIVSRETPEPWRFLALFGVTIGTAALSWHVMESPINALKRNFPYRRQPIAPARRRA